MFTGTWRVSLCEIQEAGGVGDYNNPTMLCSLEAAAVSSHTSASTPNEQYESNVHRLADGSEISTRNLPAFKKHFSSMEGK